MRWYRPKPRRGVARRAVPLAVRFGRTAQRLTASLLRALLVVRCGALQPSAPRGRHCRAAHCETLYPGNANPVCAYKICPLREKTQKLFTFAHYQTTYVIALS